MSAEDEAPPPEEISTDDGRQAAASQLMGGVGEMAGQLQMITEEMNRLRAELYSDNGLGSIKAELDKLRNGGLMDIQGQLEQIEGATKQQHAAGGPKQRAGSKPAGRATGGRGGAAGRGVSFSPDTRDVARRTGAVPRVSRQPTPGLPPDRRGRGGSSAPAQPKWMPYLVVLALICIGPARPMLTQLLGELLATALPSLWGEREPTPWYDAYE